MPNSSTTDWQPPVLTRIHSRMSAFLVGRRLWVLLGLLVVSAVALRFALARADDYWAPILLEISAGCGLLAVLQILPGAHVSFTERLLLLGSVVGLLALAGQVQGVWRGLLIEAGAGVGLFLALDLYLERVLHNMEKRENASAQLNLAALALYQTVSQWTAIPDFYQELKSDGLIPPGPEAVHVGSEEHDNVLQNKPTPPAFVTVFPSTAPPIASLCTYWTTAVQQNVAEPVLAKHLSKSVNSYLQFASRKTNADSLKAAKNLGKEIDTWLLTVNPLDKSVQPGHKPSDSQQKG